MPRTAPRQSTYAEVLTVLNDLPGLVAHERRRRGCTLRDIADEIGVSVSTLSRVERDMSSLSAGTLTQIVSWLAQRR